MGDKISTREGVMSEKIGIIGMSYYLLDWDEWDD